MNHNITEQVQEVVASVLEMEFEEIHVSSSLVEDLGADSLDVVDLSFSLGKKFNIQMPKKSIVSHAEDYFGGLKSIVHDGCLTALGANLLQQSPSKYTSEEVNEGTPLSKVYTETRVIHWVNLCVELVNTGKSGDELIKTSIAAISTDQISNYSKEVQLCRLL